MKKLLSTNYGAAAFNFSMLILRVNTGLWIIAKHGLDKLRHFSTIQPHFYNFMGIGSNISLMLAIFAELFCGALVVLGLFTRLSVIPIIIMLIVAVFGARAAHPLLNKELDFLYLIPFVVLLFCGPGRISVDGLINR
ncbi:MAG TPA: DoxX family protein [Chitinophagaceae bacterium]|jgi:putative oxidoreductase